MSLQLELPPAFFDSLKNELKDVYAEAMAEAKRDIGFMKEFLTIKEACEYATVSNNTFTNNFIAEGLPTFKIGQKIYVRKSDINDFISRHKIN
ncbi:helix-turn-helix domain-containing protein [Aerococcus urinaeequi]|uniref:Helix-turn-helix domain-containing protein n=1 Tax=Aerococcus urinaeequi TaxID=51665 RepID=A0AAE9XQV7_9LACT|nr:helix-turn-helix domain-containing protein [Aerococcus urinaeequi]WCG38540.1 helix-turn-helix domain-containing protein [Aerococcus urinaeequi]